MQNKFCKAMSNALSFRIPGDSNSLTFNPCCLYDDYLPFHPTYFEKERKKFIETTTFLPGCRKCELKEKTHGISQRTIFNNRIPEMDNSSIWKLEIVLDTTCNAACIQCGTTQSSLWRKQVYGENHIQPKSQIEDKLERLKKSIDFNTVKDFHFWGGEPLVTDTHLMILREISDPSDVELEYTTNGSVFPDKETWNIWSRFKSVKIAFSLDGMYDQFYYMRWPLRWEKVSKNLEKFCDEGTINCRYHINFCAAPLNILYIPELGEWLDNNFSISPNGTKINYNFIRSEGTVDIACTPMSLREATWKLLGDNHHVSNILKEVPVLDPTTMIKHLEHWDPIRKLNWRETFSKASPHFKD
jgi:MoaA/NifB/PqqE/SkfB family radical SAM enzyme